MFGDQSIFVRASVFERLGGFADIPLMEDIEFSRKLRRLGGPFCWIRRSAHRHVASAAWATGVRPCLTVRSSASFTLASILTHCINGTIEALGSSDDDGGVDPRPARNFAVNKFLSLMFSKMLPAPKFDRSSASQLFSRTLADRNLSCHRKRTDILQLNLGKLCNLTCIHCHVNAGPKRKEIITRETIDRVLGWLAGHPNSHGGLNRRRARDDA